MLIIPLRGVMFDKLYSKQTHFWFHTPIDLVTNHKIGGGWEFHSQLIEYLQFDNHLETHQIKHHCGPYNYDKYNYI